MVLNARGLDPVNNENLFSFIIRLQSAPGEDLQEKFWYRVKEMGMLDEGSKYDEPSAEITEEFREKVRERDELEDDGRYDYVDGEYSGDQNGYNDTHDIPPPPSPQEEEMWSRTSTTATGKRRARLEVRGSPAKSAMKAAHAAGQEWQDRRPPERQRAVSSRRSRVSDSYEGGLDDEPSELYPDNHRVPFDAREAAMRAEQFYRACQERLLDAHFQHWRLATVQREEQRFDENRALKADEAYANFLLTRFWKIWVLKTVAIVQRSEEVRQRVLARKYFVAWKAVVERNEERVRQFQLYQPFHRWRAATKERASEWQLAQRWYNQGLVRAVYVVWVQRYWTVVMRKRREEALIRKTYTKWREHTNQALKRRAMAEAFLRRMTLQKSFMVWLQRTEDWLEKNCKVGRHADLVIAVNAFQRWRTRTQTEPLNREARNRRAHYLATNTFKIWRQRTKDHIAAQEQYKRNLSRRVLRTWRLAFRQQVVQYERCTALQRRVFQTWQQKQRAAVLRRDINNRNAIKVLRIFAEKLRQRSQHLASAYQLVATRRNQSLALDILNCWRTRLNNLTTLESSAQLHRQKALLHKPFQTWHSRTIFYTHDRTLDATAFRDFFAMKYALQKLRAASFQERTARLKASFRTVSRRRLQNLAARSLSKWRARTATLQTRSETVVLERQQALKKLILDGWRENIAIIAAKRQRAEEINIQRILRTGFEAWETHFQHVRSLEQRADQYRLQSEEALKSGFMRLWKYRYWHWEHLSNNAGREAQLLQAKKMRRVLSQWRDEANNRRRPVTPPPPPLPTMEPTPQQEYAPNMSRIGIDVSPRRRQQRANAWNVTTAMTPVVQNPRSPGGWRTSQRQQQQASQLQLQPRTGFTQPPASLPHRPTAMNAPDLQLQPMTPLGSPVKRRLFAKSTLGRVVTTVNEDSGEWDAATTANTTINTTAALPPATPKGPPPISLRPISLPPLIPPLPSSARSLRVSGIRSGVGTANITNMSSSVSLSSSARMATPDLGRRRVREYVQHQQRHQQHLQQGHQIVEEDETHNRGYDDEDDEDEVGEDEDVDYEDDGTLVGTARTGSKRSAESGFGGGGRRGIAM